MVRMLRSYTKEFKEESVQLALTYGNVHKAASELGMPAATLNEWVSKAKSSSSSQCADGLSTQLSPSELLNENKELKKKLARLEQEKAILKKAATYFAKELG